MIRSVASLARRVAGSPGRLVLGLAALAALAAAAICGAAPSEARPAGPACVASAPAMAAISAAVPDARADRATLDGADLDRSGIGAIDFEGGPADLGLSRVPTDAPRRSRASITAFRPISDAILASAPGGSPLRPPRVA